MLFRMTRAPVGVTIFTCEDVKKKQLDGENISNYTLHGKLLI